MRWARLLGAVLVAATVSGCRFSAEHEFRVRADGRTDVSVVLLADAELARSQGVLGPYSGPTRNDLEQAAERMAQELRRVLEGLPARVSPVVRPREAGAQVEAQGLDPAGVERLLSRLWSWVAGRSGSGGEAPTARFRLQYRSGFWSARGRVEYVLPRIGSGGPLEVRVRVHVPGRLVSTDGRSEGTSAAVWEAYGTGPSGWAEYAVPNTPVRVGTGLVALLLLAGVVVGWRRGRKTRVCAACGAEVSARARFCTRCGAGLGG